MSTSLYILNVYKFIFQCILYVYKFLCKGILYVYKFICQGILYVYKFICKGICLQVYMSVYTGEQCGFKLSRLYCPRSLQYLYLHTVLNPTPGR